MAGTATSVFSDGQVHTGCHWGIIIVNIDTNLINNSTQCQFFQYLDEQSTSGACPLA